MCVSLLVFGGLFSLHYLLFLLLPSNRPKQEIQSFPFWPLTPQPHPPSLLRPITVGSAATFPCRHHEVEEQPRHPEDGGGCGQALRAQPALQGGFSLLAWTSVSPHPQHPPQAPRASDNLLTWCGTSPQTDWLTDWHAALRFPIKQYV